MIPSNLIESILIDGIPLILAITLHEAAHGYAAKMLGDRTAAFLGRVSLNPLKHIDPVGTILIPLMLKLAGAPFLFGYAKPVPVDFRNLKNPKKDMIWVALAGPASNMLQALIWGAMFYINLRIFNGANEFLSAMASAGMSWNLVLAIFNLFPIPPLDGGRILVGLLPYRHARTLSSLESYGIFIVIGLSMLGILGPLWMQPLMTIAEIILSILLSPLKFILGL